MLMTEATMYTLCWYLYMLRYQLSTQTFGAHKELASVLIFVWVSKDWWSSCCVQRVPLPVKYCLILRDGFAVLWGSWGVVLLSQCCSVCSHHVYPLLLLWQWVCFLSTDGGCFKYFCVCVCMMSFQAVLHCLSIRSHQQNVYSIGNLLISATSSFSYVCYPPLGAV